MRTIFILWIFLSSNLAFSQDKSFEIGKRDQLYSNVFKYNREFVVYVPPSKDTNERNTYPVLYLMDGENLFLKTVGILDHLSSAYGGERCPKMIVVGIFHRNRMKDLLPVYDSTNLEKTEPFTEFLEKELIPYIDKNYPTQQYRLLLGHSLGGLRAANTLVYHPHLFNSYIALDPSMGHDFNVWSFRTDDVIKKKTFDNKGMFLGMAHTMPIGMDTATINKDNSGAARHMRAIMRFCYTIEKNKIQGLDFNWKYYPEETHAGVTFLGIFEGLKSVFSWYHNPDYGRIFDSTTNDSDALEIITSKYILISKKMGYELLPPENYVMDIIRNLQRKDMHRKAYYFAALNIKNYPESKKAKICFEEIKWYLKNPLPDISASKIQKLCRKESKKPEPDYNISEYALNVLGYQLMEQNKVNDALLIFQVNTELYPASANTWDSYGECLLQLDRKEEALQAYKKSLELDSNNSGAKRVIKELEGN